MEKKLHLSAKQKEVIKDFRKGNTYYINPIVFRALYGKGLMNLTGKGFVLTELGNYIPLEDADKKESNRNQV